MYVRKGRGREDEEIGSVGGTTVASVHVFHEGHELQRAEASDYYMYALVSLPRVDLYVRSRNLASVMES